MTAMNVAIKVLLLGLLTLSAVAADAPEPRLGEHAADGRVLAWLLAMPAAVTDVLVADTSASTMYRFERKGAGFQQADSRYMSIGSKGVGKQKAWDRKTPLGVYFVTNELDASRLPAKYGKAVYPLDYPNSWDRYQQRTGSGIWLHGVDPATPLRPPLDTDGCLALPNDELINLAAVLKPLVTPVIIARNMRWAEPAELEHTRTELLIQIDRWRVSAERSDLIEHLGFYADDFRYQGMDKAHWSAYKQGVFASRKPTSVNVKDVMLIADPEESELYISRFSEVVDSGGAVMEITKRLYWRHSASDGWQIVTEDTG
jgi:murein L,D-transpeptidase YafK